MTKRSYPYEDNLLPQLKIHVGQRQVDTGIDEERRMKEVYDKTLNLLKQGAKKYSQNMNNDQMDLTELPSALLTSHKLINPQRASKQMVLNNKLQLENNDNVKLDKNVDVCRCFQVIDPSLSNKCSYCEELLCPSCLNNCIKCHDLICDDCSLPKYDMGSSTVCLDCLID
ncbi:apoptosis regulatory protein Siva-like [Polistes fuscatus]|uniref:apoptosis regulatory protein Siva-like n=1 Tax=Polistes fuscatus TaxID=30207 RepID=UPI001CA9597D|nr:apoptosis regulatory protein Siva-like [Polistes fuscatus]